MNTQVFFQTSSSLRNLHIFERITDLQTLNPLVILVYIFFKTFIFFFHIYYLFYILHLLYNPNNLKWQPIKANKFSWFPNTLPINPPDPLLQRPHEGWGWRGENLMKSCEPLKNYFFSLTFIFQYIDFIFYISLSIYWK